MNISDRISERQRHEAKRYEALNAAAAIVQMDPHAREDLISYLKAFNEAQAAKNEQELEYLTKAILEVFGNEVEENAVDLDDWETAIRAFPAGHQAAKELQTETDRFFETYNRLKARSRFRTIRELAKAAKISPTTVQAIEKQRVKPQFKTIQALAKAFDVDPEVLTKS